MKVYVLIDTCILKRLISTTEYGWYLRQIEHLVQTGQITILVPDKLKQEWEKHTIEERKKIKNSLDVHRKTLLAATAIYQVEYDIDISPAEKRLSAQVDAIDNLLSGGEEVPDFKDAIYLSHNLKKSRSAPYHIKLDSDSDAHILFNSMHYINNLPTKVFYLLSSNTNEFSNLHSASEFNSDLAAHYSKVKVKYYINAKSFLSGLKNSGFNLFNDDQKEIISYKQTFFVEKTGNIIDQIDRYISIVFKEWSFLPKMFFTEQYPFIEGQFEAYNRKPFFAYVDNEQTLKLLSSIRKGEKGFYLENESFAKEVKDIQQKISKIVVTFSHNLIYFIHDQDRKEIPFYQWDYTQTNDILTNYLNFDFTEIFSIKPHKDDDAYVLLKKAYIQAQMGLLIDAANTNIIASERAEKESPILFYISQYNLTNILRLIKQTYPFKNKAEDLIQNLKKINLNDAFRFSSKDNPILIWLHERQFSNDYNLKINSLAYQIRIKYFNRSKGFNNDSEELLQSFYELSGFLMYNNIIGETFIEFQNIANVFIEGVFASYASSDKIGGTISNFNDKLLLTIVRYGDHEEIRNCIDRYKLKSLKYNSYSHRAFLKVFIKFLRDYQKVVSAYDENNGEEAIHFWDTYETYLNNFLTLSTYLELSNDQLREIVDEIYLLLQQQELRFIFFRFLKVLSNFFKLCGGKLFQEQLSKMFMYCILDPRFNDTLLVYYLQDALSEKDNYHINVSTEDFDAFKKIYLKSESLAVDKATSNINWLYDVMANLDFKDEITVFIQNELVSRFDFRVFYSFSITGVISFNNDLLNQYHEFMHNYIMKTNDTNLRFSKSCYTNSTIDSYLNFVFKHKIKLPAKIKAALEKLGPYYKWILNINTFNYEEFDYRWLYNYWTIYFKARFRKSSALKKHLIKFIKSNSKTEAQEVFINIYHT